MIKVIHVGWLPTLLLAWGCTSQNAHYAPPAPVELVPANEVEEEVFAEASSEPEVALDAGPVLTGEPVKVTDADFEEKVLRSSVPVMVDFWAPWCPPCRALAPTIDALAAEYQGRVLVAKLDTDENPASAEKFDIEGLPTLMFFKNGQRVNALVGLQPKAEIVRVLDSLLGS